MYLQTSTKLIDISILKKRPLLLTYLFMQCPAVTQHPGLMALEKSQLWISTQVFKGVQRSLWCQTEHMKKLRKQVIMPLQHFYGCKPGMDLNFERGSRFSEKVVSSSWYLPTEHMPPTSDADRFHSYRVYLQVQACLGEEMEPTE